MKNGFKKIAISLTAFFLAAALQACAPLTISYSEGELVGPQRMEVGSYANYTHSVLPDVEGGCSIFDSEGYSDKPIDTEFVTSVHVSESPEGANPTISSIQRDTYDSKPITSIFFVPDLPGRYTLEIVVEGTGKICGDTEHKTFTDQYTIEVVDRTEDGSRLEIVEIEDFESTRSGRIQVEEFKSIPTTIEYAYLMGPDEPIEVTFDTSVADAGEEYFTMGMGGSVYMIPIYASNVDEEKVLLVDLDGDGFDEIYLKCSAEAMKDKYFQIENPEE